MTHQAFMNTTRLEDGKVVLQLKAGELEAVLRSAASLADREGMAHTADRLRNDADLVKMVRGFDAGMSIEVVK